MAAMKDYALVTLGTTEGSSSRIYDTSHSKMPPIII